MGLTTMENTRKKKQNIIKLKKILNIEVFDKKSKEIVMMNDVRKKIIYQFIEMLKLYGLMSIRDACDVRALNHSTISKIKIDADSEVIMKKHFNTLLKILNKIFKIDINDSSGTDELESVLNKIKKLTKVEYDLIICMLNIVDEDILNSVLNYLSFYTAENLQAEITLDNLTNFINSRNHIIQDFDQKYFEKLIELCDDSYHDLIKLNTYYINDEENDEFEVHIEFEPVIARLCMLEPIVFYLPRKNTPEDDIYMYLQDQSNSNILLDVMDEKLRDLKTIYNNLTDKKQIEIYKKAIENLDKLIHIVYNDCCIDWGEFEEYTIEDNSGVLTMLYGMLAQDDRYDDIKRAKNDIYFAKKLAEEYGIAEFFR